MSKSHTSSPAGKISRDSKKPKNVAKAPPPKLLMAARPVTSSIRPGTDAGTEG
jgi:hypothetical protein